MKNLTTKKIAIIVLILILLILDYSFKKMGELRHSIAQLEKEYKQDKAWSNEQFKRIDEIETEAVSSLKNADFNFDKRMAQHMNWRNFQSSRMDELDYKSDILGDKIQILEEQAESSKFRTPKRINMSSSDPSLLAQFACGEGYIKTTGSESMKDLRTNVLNRLSYFYTLERKSEKLKCGFKFKNSYSCLDLEPLFTEIAHDSKGSISVWFKGNQLGTVFAVADSEINSIFQIYQNRNKMSVGFMGESGVSSWLVNVYSDSNEAGWIHLVAVQDGVKAKIYFNGQEVEKLEYISDKNLKAWFADHQNFNNASMGCSNYNTWLSSHSYEGLLNDFRYYKSVLSDVDVQKIYQEGLELK